MGRKMIDVTGKQFGRLIVTGLSHRKDNVLYWSCICACGRTHTVKSSHLRTGWTQSCGCLSADTARSVHTKHGRKRTPEYAAWRDMFRRCTDPKHKNFKDYGARGISVDPLWRDFSVFFADLGPRPFVGAQLDRTDNNAGYCKTNCTWVTQLQNSRNKRNTVRVQYCGVEVKLIELCEKLGVSRHKVYNRISRLGWSVNRAVDTP